VSFGAFSTSALRSSTTSDDGAAPRRECGKTDTVLFSGIITSQIPVKKDVMRIFYCSTYCNYRVYHVLELLLRLAYQLLLKRIAARKVQHSWRHVVPLYWNL